MMCDVMKQRAEEMKKNFVSLVFFVVKNVFFVCACVLRTLGVGEIAFDLSTDARKWLKKGTERAVKIGDF